MFNKSTKQSDRVNFLLLKRIKEVQFTTFTCNFRPQINVTNVARMHFFLP